MPWASDDVDGRYISLQTWLYIFLKNLLLFERLDLNLNYVYDIELRYCFSLLVVID